MPHSTKTRLLGLLKPAAFVHRDGGKGRRGHGCGGGDDGDGDGPRRAAKQPAPGTQEGQEACERLERIAMYARAGYFNMGYTLDMMQTPGEILPD
ncbi:MAG TPA: hypothetical protein VGN31_14180 [Paraburkholderia sp.]